MVRIATIVLLSMVALSGRGYAQEADQKEIRAMLMRTVDAWNRGDVRGYMEGYWRSDSLVFAADGSAMRGWRTTFKHYLQRYDSPEKMGRLEYTNLEITLLADNAAWAMGKWKLHRIADAPHGLYTLVLKKMGGEWKIVLDHTTTGDE